MGPLVFIKMPLCFYWISFYVVLQFKDLPFLDRFAGYDYCLPLYQKKIISHIPPQGNSRYISELDRMIIFFYTDTCRKTCTQTILAAALTFQRPILTLLIKILLSQFFIHHLYFWLALLCESSVQLLTAKQHFSY